MFLYTSYDVWGKVFGSAWSQCFASSHVQYIYPMVAFYSVDKTQILDICNTSLYLWNYHRRQVAAALGRICAAEIKRFGFVVVDS